MAVWSSSGRLRGLVTLILALSAAPASAETYPTRAITIITPFAAGSATDAAARMIGQYLQDAPRRSCREPRRRRRSARGQCRRAGKGRRLHAVLHHQFNALGRKRPVQERAVRSDQGFHADRAHRKLPVLRRGQSGVAGKLHGRPGSVCQGQSGEALLRGRQLDRAYCRRDDQEAHRDRHRARELPQQSGGGHRARRRPYSDGDPGFQHRYAPTQDAEGPRPRGTDKGAQPGPA